jgi:prolyl-tRNA synthetase
MAAIGRYDYSGRKKRYVDDLPLQHCTQSPPDQAHAFLLQAGFIRQVMTNRVYALPILTESKAHSGIYHNLPFGLRVERKLRQLIDHYMNGIGMALRSRRVILL